MSTAHPMVARLERFLAARDPTMANAKVTAFEPITGGMSRTMARFTLAREGTCHPLVVRTDPVAGAAILESDRAAEWNLLEHIARDGRVPVPQPRWFDPTGEFLGTPGIVMDAVSAENLVTVARARDLAEQKQLGLRLAELAAAIAQVPAATLPDRFARPSSWTSYIDGQIGQWAALERANPGSDPFMRYVGAWLEAHRPPPAPLGLVHGDFQISNVLVGPGDAFTLVDWELGRIGDPREDLGWFRLVGALTPPDLIALDDAAFCLRYRECSGLTEDVVNPATIAYFTVLGSLRVFSGIQGQAAALARGEGGSTAIAYCILVQASIHRVWMGAIQALSAARGVR